MITPVVLTFNEEPNLARTLDHLRWAARVVIVDSFSTDRTMSIAAKYPNVEVFQRTFDNHTNQWNFGLEKVTTSWCLTLDADYVVSAEGAREMQDAVTRGDADGYAIDLRFCVLGHPIDHSILPPRLALFRRDKGVYVQDGHTQLLDLRGRAGKLTTAILHDDRKELGRWLWAQNRYAELEAEKLSSIPFADLAWADRVRRAVVVAPVLVPAFYLIWRRGVLDGWPGIHYAAQRSIAELVISIKLLERSFVRPTDRTSAPSRTERAPSRTAGGVDASA